VILKETTALFFAFIEWLDDGAHLILLYFWPDSPLSTVEIWTYIACEGSVLRSNMEAQAQAQLLTTPHFLHPIASNKKGFRLYDRPRGRPLKNNQKAM
jgi:hypothetical protein